MSQSHKVARSLVSSIFSLFLIAQANAYTLDITCDKNGVLTSETPPPDLTGVAMRVQLASFLGKAPELDPPGGCPGQSTTSSLNPPDRGMLIVDEINSMVRDHSSNRYDQAKINDIVELALRNGVDPYAALATSILELTPLLPQPATHRRLEDDVGMGQLIAVVDGSTFTYALGCSSQDYRKDSNYPSTLSAGEIQQFQSQLKQRQALEAQKDQAENLIFTLLAKPGESKTSAEFQAAKAQASVLRQKLQAFDSDPGLSNFRSANPSAYYLLSCIVSDSKHCVYLSQVPTKVQTLDLSASSGVTGPSTSVDACWDSQVPTGEALSRAHYFWPTPAGSSAQHACCAHLKIPQTWLRNPVKANKDPQVTPDVGVNLQKKVTIQILQEKIQRGFATRKGLKGMPLVAYALQGFNGYGDASSVNRCMTGMSMESQPLYGAKAGDIMLNMLIANPQVEQMVKDAQKVTGQPQKSVFCSALGAGKHQIDSDVFAAMEEQFSSARPACNEGLQGKPPISFAQWNSCSEFEKGTTLNCK